MLPTREITKRIITIFLSTCLFTSAFAQHTITGKVVSDADGTALEMTTIRLFRYANNDSTLVQGAQTGMEGTYVLSGIAAGEYKLYISNVGFKEQSKYIRVAAKDVTVPTVRLKEDVQALSEVQVQGHAAEMIVKGDTIEYNAAAYKVGENAMVEDLLKKMNGVTVDKEGNVTGAQSRCR